MSEPSEPIWKPPGGPLSEDQRVAGLRKLLDGASPAVRRAAISLAIHADLEAARRAYAKVYEDGERFKADLIRANGKAARQTAERLGEAFDVSAALVEVAGLLVQVTGETEARAGTLALVMAQLGAVCGPWRDVQPGREAGAGLSGYDEPDAVAHAKADAVRIHEQYLARQARKSAAP